MNKIQKIWNGWILYSNRDSGINMHYVNLYRKACEKRGMNVRFGVYDPELLSAGLEACRIEDEQRLSVCGIVGILWNPCV